MNLKSRLNKLEEQTRPERLGVFLQSFLDEDLKDNSSRRFDVHRLSQLLDEVQSLKAGLADDSLPIEVQQLAKELEKMKVVYQQVIKSIDKTMAEEQEWYKESLPVEDALKLIATLSSSVNKCVDRKTAESIHQELATLIGFS